MNSVVYVNYSPYENSGKILDYLLENFKYVFLFSIAFHPLGKKQKTNRVVVYKNKKIVNEFSMGYMSIDPKFVLFLIPIRSILNFIQLFYHMVLLRIRYGKIDIFFSVNGFTAWTGLIFKWLGFVKKTVFWVWDYYPINSAKFVVRIMRWLYWIFDKAATKSDRVVYLNHRLAKVRKDANLIPMDYKYPVVSIGTDIVDSKVQKKGKVIKIGFIGVVKKSQGLDMLFNAAETVNKNFTNISYEIIGTGPDSEYFIKRAKKEKIKTTFYGYVDEVEFTRILSSCTIGIAPYDPDDNNLSFYGDPGKVKRYLSFGLPAIITNVFELSDDLIKNKAGVVVDYYNPQSLVDAIKEIMSRYSFYSNNAVKFNKKFYYKKIYPTLFNN